MRSTSDFSFPDVFTMQSIVLSRKAILDLWADGGTEIALDTIYKVSTHICNALKTEDAENLKRIKSEVSKVCYRMRDRWRASNNYWALFNARNSEWLQVLETFSLMPQEQMQKVGAPSKDFSTCCDRSKRRKVEHLRKSASTEELAYAAEMNAREEGKEDAAKLLHEIMLTSPTRPSKMRQALQVQRSSGAIRKTSRQASLKESSLKSLGTA